MSKKGIVIASAVAAAFALSGCAQHHPADGKSAMNGDQSSYQSGYSSKLGKGSTNGHMKHKNAKNGYNNKH